MKTMLEVCVYSGMCNWDPRCEMTKEQTEALNEKVSKLHKTATANRFGTGVLGMDSFMVVFGVTEIREDGFEMVPAYEDFLKGLKFTMVRALPGRITVHKIVNGSNTYEMYEDTENIHQFLAELAAPAIQAAHDRANRQIQEYWDNVGTPDEIKK